MSSHQYMKLEDQFGAHNYKPLDVVLCRGEGVWVWDVQGNKYLDCLSDLTKSFPPELLESDNGVGVYFNPDEGQEVMREFYDIINGLKKNGIKWPDRGARR